MTISPRVPSSPASFYAAGVDLGQKHDHSAIAVVQKRGNDVYLVYLKQFPLGTPYGSVRGYLRLLSERLGDLRRILIDQTGVGEVFVDEAVKEGLKNAQGIVLSQPRKMEVMSYLRHLMEDGRLHTPFDLELFSEMNVERFEVLKTGQIRFSHPSGTHDDRLWALALAVYASRPEVPEYHPVAALGRVIKPLWAAPRTETTARPVPPAHNQEICLTCGKPKVPDQEHIH